MVRLEGAWYSVPERWVGLKVTAWRGDTRSPSRAERSRSTIPAGGSAGVLPPLRHYLGRHSSKRKTLRRGKTRIQLAEENPAVRQLAHRERAAVENIAPRQFAHLRTRSRRSLRRALGGLREEQSAKARGYSRSDVPARWPDIPSESPLDQTAKSLDVLASLLHVAATRLDGRGYDVRASKFPQQGVLESSMSIRPRDSGARHEPPRRPPLARPRHVLALLVLVLALALLGFVGNASAQTPTVTVQFKEASYEVNEGDTLTVTVEVSGTVPSGGFTVYAMDTAIGATGMGVDYVSGPFELAFTAGDHDPTATFPLVTIGDSESDDAEDFAIVLSDYGLPDGVGLGTRFTTEVTINEAADDDACAPNLPSDAVTVSEVTGWRNQFSHSAHVLRWNRVLTALGQDTGETAMSASEAQAHYNQYNNTRWDRTLRTLQALEQCDSLPPDPEISIAAGSAVSEGSDATFTITATPKPSADLDVTVEVSQSGDYASTGSQTVTIPSNRNPNANRYHDE